jgi:hypothetical protein
MKTVEQHYTPRELAGMLQVSMSTVRRYLRAGYRTQGRDGIWPWAQPTIQCIRIPASSVNLFLQRSQPKQV